MILCDIGNSSYHFLEVNSEYFKDTDDLNSQNAVEMDYKEDSSIFNPSAIKERVFYICVNKNVKTELKKLQNWIDLSQYVDMSKYYNTMGVDRVMVCEAVKDGVIVDAGSAVTVDLVKDRKFMGGFIYPGVQAMSETYKNISAALDYSFNFECDLDIMPKNSRDSISYGYLKALYSEVISHDMEIYLTGGDAKKFAKVFPQAKVDERLIFNGMKKIIKKADLC